MSKRGRPKKPEPQSLYSVKDWIEYTSDSDSDINHIEENGRPENVYVQTSPLRPPKFPRLSEPIYHSRPLLQPRQQQQEQPMDEQDDEEQHEVERPEQPDPELHQHEGDRYPHQQPDLQQLHQQEQEQGGEGLDQPDRNFEDISVYFLTENFISIFLNFSL